MDTRTHCGRVNLIWAVFLLILAGGWILNTLGVVETSIWRIVGPLGLLFGAFTLFTMRQ